MNRSQGPGWIALTLFGSALLGPALAQEQTPKLTVDWNKVIAVSKTTPTLQVVVNPPLRRGHPVHDGAFKSLKDLQADYVRYVPWLPYPRLGVAELEPPKDGKTSWDFSLIDPMTIDFLEATKGHPVVLNFSTIPQWMVKTDKPVAYPADANQPVWDYTQGSDFRDPSFKEVADYYARLLAWYTQGGFTDELGKRHESGHRFKISHWEVLNEPDLERHWTPEAYTRLYDAVVEAMRKVEPATKFGGISLAHPPLYPLFFEYFLNPKNHKAGIPLDFITYHFYAIPAIDEGPKMEPHVFFAQADAFLNMVRYVEVIRKRLSPTTQTMINEVGTISSDDLKQFAPGHEAEPIPPSYWNLSGALYAYLFSDMSRQGIDVVGESQLVGYPTQFPSVSMVEWQGGQPNPRLWVLKLLKDSFGPGDRLVDMQLGTPSSPFGRTAFHAQGFVTRGGKRRLLLVSKRAGAIELLVPGASGGQIDYVDETTGFGPPGSRRIDNEKVTLNGYGVVVLTLP